LKDPNRLAADAAHNYHPTGIIVGLGTGSTTHWAILKIGERVREGLQIKAVASSDRSENLARELGIQIIPFKEVGKIDVTIDGADEVDKNFNLIKGGGGALLREKILIYNSKKFYVIVDESKLVTQLGKFPLPVEAVPFASDLTIKHLTNLGCDAVIRKAEDDIYKTDNGNLIVDCHFKIIPDPQKLDLAIRSIPGIVETGLFQNELVTAVVVGHKNGTIEVKENPQS
jgi:ribose 5-phosphate isomerase A